METVKWGRRSEPPHVGCYAEFGDGPTDFGFSRASGRVRSAPSFKKNQTVNSTEQTNIPGFQVRPAPRGVIYVTNEAMDRGFSYDDPNWANLGQGFARDRARCPGAPPRIEQLNINPLHQQYAPVRRQ